MTEEEIDQHFQQQKHAHGMKVLGVPNTKHFHDITKIQDALDLCLQESTADFCLT